MLHVFIDESGDLGKRLGSSRYFVLVAVYTDDPVSLRKKFRKIIHKFYYDRKVKNELHASHEKPEIVEKILKKINDLSFKAFYSVCKKKDGIKDIYDSLCHDLIQLILNKTKSKKLFIKVDKRETNKSSRKRFEENIINSFKDTCNIEMSSVASYEEVGIQIADAIAWSVFRKFELNDDRFLKIIQKKTLPL